MNRRYLLIFSIIIALLLVGLAVYSWHITSNSSQLETQAKITNITADTSFEGCLVGVTTDIWFNITVQNTGKTDITGANITIEIAGVNDTSICNYDNQTLGTLYANETRQVQAIILTNLDHFYQVANSNFTAKLIVNGTMWDERTYYNIVPTVTPIPTSTPTYDVTFSCHEGSRKTIGDNTQLFLVINATLTNGDSAAIDYFKFYLFVWLQSQDGTYHLNQGHHFTPTNTGEHTLDSANRTAIFVLTFEFPTGAVDHSTGNFASFSGYSMNYLDQAIGITTNK
jgi:hypothetical protein